MPLFYTTQAPLLGVWKITEPWQMLLATLQHPERYASEVNAIKSDKRKQEWLAVRLLLKELTASSSRQTAATGQVAATGQAIETGLNIKAAVGPTIDYYENGAPYLRDLPLHISISHTTGYAAVIVSPETSPGIDIEYRSNRAWRLRDKFMSPQEQALLTSLPAEQPDHIRPSDTTTNTKTSKRADLATLCWCAKETAYKVLQQNEIDFIGHLHIQPFTLSEAGVFTLKEMKRPQQKELHIHYSITDEFILTWYVARETTVLL